MLVAHSKNRRPKVTDAFITDVLRGVSAERLRAYVEMLAFPARGPRWMLMMLGSGFFSLKT